jgi:uncharacterized protein (TIGR02246 family)
LQLGVNQINGLREEFSQPKGVVMNRAFFAALILSLITFAAPALAGPREEVKAAFAAWADSLKSGDADAITKLYARDAILLSTIADDPMTTPEERLAYFKAIMQLPKLSVHVNEQYLRVMHSNSAVVSGLYTFEYEYDSKMFYVPARFTFVYEINNDQWLIVDQHSSQMPSAK